ncbi:hypothetical protein FS837_007113 [Tulasnella sp. UAMH 9824]|nr:hypothetical protein FS837_007113 [Tulasnella sp. UAMH 9824]
MVEPDTKWYNDSQSVICITPLLVSSTPLENGSGTRKQCPPEAGTLGPQEYETIRPGFQQDNPSKSINDLPLEIVIHILGAVLKETINTTDFRGGYYLRTLESLAAVCRAWKAIVESTPSLWTVIESTAMLDEMEYMLHKSGNCTLNLRYVNPGHDTLFSESFAGSDFLSLTTQSMRRCSSLSVRVEDSSRAAPSLESAAPVLREAAIVAVRSHTNGPVNLFDGQAEMLVDLRLTRIPIRWDLGLPPRLRWIRIAYSSLPTVWLPHPHDVASALSGCAGIEIVHLSGPSMVFGLREWTDLEVQGPIVDLPRLKELKIENIFIARSSAIVGHLRAPSLKNLRLKETLQADSIIPLLQPPNSLLLHHIRHALAQNKSLHLTIGRKRILLRIEGKEEDVYLSFFCTDPDELGRWLVDEFVSELSSVPELVLEVTSTHPIPAHHFLGNLLQALPNLIGFHCPCVNGAAGILAEHLASPYHASDGWRWHWPGLRNLKLEGADEWHEVALKMLQERYGTSEKEYGDRGIGTPKWCPRPLFTLSLPGMKFCRPKTFRDIAGIVGKGVLEGDDSDDEGCCSTMVFSN